MAPLDPLFEFRMHPTGASLEAPLGKTVFDLHRLAEACDSGSAYNLGFLTIRGKSRALAMPRPGLDAVQRRINQILYPVDISLGLSAHGYVARRSTLSNARPHAGARYLQKFDIKDFFSNVNVAQVESTFIGLGFGAEAAALLSRLVTCRGRLPLGARTSPRVSNMVLIDFDDQMELLAQEHSLNYTRYADDLTFSSPVAFDLSAAVQHAVESAGFQLNAAKTKRFKHGQPMFVTGLSVADSSGPRVRRRLKARLRQEFYYIEKYGVDEHASAIREDARRLVDRLTGEYHYCRAIEPEFAEMLKHRYPAALTRVVPVYDDSRAERARRHRRAFVAEVMNVPPNSLPYYVPAVSMFDT